MAIRGPMTYEVLKDRLAVFFPIAEHFQRVIEIVKRVDLILVVDDSLVINRELSGIYFYEDAGVPVDDMEAVLDLLLMNMQ